MYTFYVDQWILQNMVMDYIGISMTALLFALPVHRKRWWAGAAAGSFVSLLLLLYLPGWPYEVLVHLVVNPLMTKVVFQIQGRKSWLLTFLGMYSCFFLLGGIAGWIYGTLQCSAILTGIILLSIKEVIVRIIAGRKSYLENTYQVEIIEGKQSLQVIGLIDTGNHLQEPGTHCPVHIVGEHLLTAIIEENGLLPRLIPYNTISGEHHLMKVYTVSKMILKKGQKKILIENAVIGIGRGNLFKQESFEILLNAKILN